MGKKGTTPRGRDSVIVSFIAFFSLLRLTQINNLQMDVPAEGGKAEGVFQLGLQSAVPLCDSSRREEEKAWDGGMEEEGTGSNRYLMARAG